MKDFLILLPLFLGFAFGQTAAVEKHIDREWFRQQLLEELERYRTIVPSPNGFLKPNLDRQWRVLPVQYATLVSQTRLLFVQSTGYRVTNHPDFMRAAQRGGEFILTHFRDREFGGWFRRVSPVGELQDDAKDSYSHAFAIFGLVHAWRATGDERFRQAALETWQVMKEHLRDGEVFIKPRTTRDFAQVKGTNSQNPMMHLFEALLDLYAATESKVVFEDAKALADAIYGRLFQDAGGYLPELFDADWAPLPEDKGGRVEVGHQFEWAFLLSQAVDAGFPRRYLEIGHRLIDYGMKVGYDSGSAGIFSRATYSGKSVPQPKGRWQQCEFLRAIIHYAARRGRDDLWRPAEETLAFVKQNFIDKEYGGWFRTYDPATPRAPKLTHKGTEWMAGYHVTNLHLEALR